MLAMHFRRPAAEAPARLAAANCILEESGCAAVAGALLFRLGEFCANVLLFGGLLWLVEPMLNLVLFVFLWYVPAALHNKSFSSPLKYPLLNFVVDDFSLLGLHPHPRCARAMYKVAVCRTLLMLSLIVLLNESSSFLPAGVIEWIHHSSALKALRSRIVVKRLFPELVRDVWGFLAFFVVGCSTIWVIITAAFLCLPRWCNGNPTPFYALRNDECLNRIEALAAQVRQIATAEDLTTDDGAPRRCRENLVKLREEHWPRFRLTNLLNTLCPAWGALLRFGVDWFNIGTFISNGDFGFALFLVATMSVTVGYAWATTLRGPHRIFQETKLSLECGLLTHDFLVLLRADKGFHMIPMLMVQLYGLPFAAKSRVKALSAVGSVVVTIAYVVPFIHHDFDLGVETEGMNHSEQRRSRDQVLAETGVRFLVDPSHATVLFPIREMSGASQTFSSTLSMPKIDEPTLSLKSCEVGALQATDDPQPNAAAHDGSSEASSRPPPLEAPSLPLPPETSPLPCSPGGRSK